MKRKRMTRGTETCGFVRSSDEAFSAESDDSSDKEKDALALRELEAESDNELSAASSVRVRGGRQQARSPVLVVLFVRHKSGVFPEFTFLFNAVTLSADLRRPIGLDRL